MAEVLETLVTRVQRGDRDAFETIVRRFQDMAVGYGYAVLGDMAMAEDAAQEAFINAYRDLPALREPAAFPGWFRQIVFKHIDRTRRKLRAGQVPLEQARRMNPPQPLDNQDGYSVHRLLPEIPRLLLDHGADRSARDSLRGLTPLGWAEANLEDETDRSEVAALLR